MHVHSARYTVHTCKLLQAKKFQRILLPVKYKQPLPTHPLQKTKLYIVVKCGNIYRVTNNDNRSTWHLSNNYTLFSFLFKSCVTDIIIISGVITRR